MEYIKVSGNIVSELSEKVPNYLVALNELIKNSYDADSESISIELDSKMKTLVISDKGNGMDIEDIRSLIHISKSTKEYAKVKENGWIVQGSKGLGFLAVFKFGNLVTWTTKTSKGIGHEFSFDYNELITQDNITDFGLAIKTNSNVDKGTRIEILISAEVYQSVYDYFSESKNINKVLYSFTPEDFFIKFKIDNKEYNNTPRIDFTEILKERQLFKIEYNSKDNKIEYYRGKDLLTSKKFDLIASDFKINLKLIAYSLQTNDKKKISPLYYNYYDELTPLIYINTNLFNNYDLFNPNITQKIKYSNILNQMIGVIEIYSGDKRLDFNSDRTNFIQNAFTDEISQFLKELNIKIQTYGSELKPHLSKQDFLKKIVIEYNLESDLTDELFRENIKDTFYFRDKVSIKKINDNQIEYSIFDLCKIIALKNISPEKSPASKPKCAKIELRSTQTSTTTNSGQIDLRDYIIEVQDSCGKKVDRSDVDIYIDGNISSSGILPSVEDSRTIQIKYLYKDESTGNCSSVMSLVISDRELRLEKPKEILIPNPISNGYKIKMEIFSSVIVSQLNSMKSLENYDAVIAAALRSVFETATDEIYRSSKYDTLLNGKNALEDRVEAIIEYAHSNKDKILNKIDDNTKLGYTNLKQNIYIAQDYKNKIILCHKGAHKASEHLSLSEIKTIGKSLSYYLILVDFML